MLVFVPVLTEPALPTTPPGVAGGFGGGIRASSPGRAASDTDESSWARSSCEIDALSIACSASSRQLDNESPRMLSAAAFDQIGRSDGADDDELSEGRHAPVSKLALALKPTRRQPDYQLAQTAGSFGTTHRRGDGRTKMGCG